MKKVYNFEIFMMFILKKKLWHTKRFMPRKLKFLKTKRKKKWTLTLRNVKQKNEYIFIKYINHINIFNFNFVKYCITRHHSRWNHSTETRIMVDYVGLIPIGLKCAGSDSSRSITGLQSAHGPNSKANNSFQRVLGNVNTETIPNFYWYFWCYHMLHLRV